MGNSWARHWSLDPEVDFLNHGSFGACPTAVLEVQQGIRDEIERQPVAFFVRRYQARLDAARERLARFLGADPQGLAAVSNATSGRGLLISWAIPAAKPPTETIFSDCTIISSTRTREVTSSNRITAP